LIQETDNSHNVDSNSWDSRIRLLRIRLSPPTFSTGSVKSGNAHNEPMMSAFTPLATTFEWACRDVCLVPKGGHQSPSNPTIIFGCTVAAFMARIEHAPQLDQQQLNLILGIRFVLNALRDNKHLTGRNVNGAITYSN
jgi:hypothetical protein